MSFPGVISQLYYYYINNGVEEYLIISFCFCYRIKDKKIYPLKFAIELYRKYECLLFQFHLAISLNSIGSNFGCCLKCNLQIGDIINFSYLHHAAVGEVRSLRLNIVSIQYDGHEILLACVLLICRLKIFFRVSIFFVSTNTRMMNTTKFIIAKYLRSVSSTITSSNVTTSFGKMLKNNILQSILYISCYKDL